MIVKCCKPFSLQAMLGHQIIVRYQSDSSFHITVGEKYLVIEFIIDFTHKKNSIRYRIIDNAGYPAIYESDCFEIVSGSLDGFCIAKATADRGITITHKLIADSNFSTDYGGGFWEVYFDTDNKETRDLLKNVIKDLSLRAKIPAPVLTYD